ncbi:MAG: InlB B-repeat-containing protein [Ruminococcus sp.]|nr:InlB B-repeat-containing protein [Ruminococcus sp.]
MLKHKFKKRVSKGFVSVLLMIAVMLSLAVPFDFTVFAAEDEPATGEDIYALLYIKDTSKTGTGNKYFNGMKYEENLELVFQNGPYPDSKRLANSLVAVIGGENSGQDGECFANTRYHHRTFKSDTKKQIDKDLAGYNGTTYCPWYNANSVAQTSGGTISNISNNGKNIVKVTFKDKIQPQYTASWFYNFQKLSEISNFTNLDTSACEDMSFMFHSNYALTSLDLSHFDVRNVKEIDFFIHGNWGGNLHTVKMAGENWHLDKVEYMKQFIYACPKLVNLDLSGLDISNVLSVNGFVNDCSALETLDVSSINPKRAYDFMYAFQNCKGLKTVEFGLFQLGKDNDIWELCRINGMFSNCELLENVDFADWDLPYSRVTDEGGTKTKEERLARVEYASVFNNCKSLKKMTSEEHFEKFIYNYGSPGTWIHRNMFYGCESLEEVDFSSMESFIGGISIFKGCKNLRKINLARMGNKYITTDLWQRRYGFSSYDTSGNNAMRYNIYEGCDNLSEFTFSEWYPPAIVYDNRKNPPTPLYYDTLKYYDSSKTLVGGENPDVPPIDLDRYWVKIKHPETDTCSIADSQLVPVGEQLTARELFTDFQRNYAGTWVTKAAVVLDSDGGVPSLQSIESAVGLPVDYDPADVQTPEKTGYVFDGWYATDENGVEKKLEDQLAANQADPDSELIAAWTYKAKWIENTYTLKLYGNGGESDDHATEVTADDDLLYSEYYDLNNAIFKREGYVLSGWNTRPNGTGDAYSANEAVNKLTATNGGEAKLYAQWHKPDVIITFDSQGGSAVANKNYTLKTGEATTYGDLAESVKTGYTFVGWYTKADNTGTKIESDTEVGSSCTLYAHWVENPTITFDANGGGSAYFDDDPTKTTLIKHYKYGQNLGVLPTPFFGASELDGWYTAATGGTKVTTETPAETNTTYYAHWGYKPQFDSNGGVYTSNTITQIFPAYKVETDANYKIYKTAGSSGRPTLPEFTVTEGFKGWMFGNRNLSDEIDNLSDDNGYITINLSSGTHVIADWETKVIRTVTLDPQGGTLPNLYYDEENDQYRIKVYDGKAIEELPTPTRTENGVEYEFLGWYTAASGGDRKDYSFTPTADCTLYAHWAAKTVTVTFDPGEGALVAPDANVTTRSEKIPSGGSVNAIPGATRDGFVFGGWYTDVADETTKLTTSTPISNNTTYHAKWTATDNSLIISSDNIYKYTVRWSTPSNDYATNTGDHIVIAPKTGASGVSVGLYVEFDFDQVAASQAGNKVLSPETVKIYVPKYIFENSSGTPVGTNNIGNGLEKKGGDTLDSNFVYDDTTDNDYYIITNNDEIDGSQFQNQVFNISYTLDASQLRSLNGGYIDETGAFAGNYYLRDLNYDPSDPERDQSKDPLNVRIIVNQENVAPANYTKELGLEVHTEAKASALKEQANASFGWSTDWGPEPADADQYFYVTWTLTSAHENTSSQKFKVSWSEDPVHEGSVVYTKTQGGDKFYESGTFKTTVVTKHPRLTGDSGWKTIYNEAVLTVEYISGHKAQYRTSGTAGVYILPYGDTRAFEKYIKDYGKAETSRIKEGAQELILNRTGYNYLPFSITYQEYKNLDNSKKWYEKTKTYSTVEREMTISDGAKGDKDIVLSTVKGATPYSWNATTDSSSALVGEALGDSDYHFNTIDLYLTEFDAVYLKPEGAETGEWSEPYQHDSYKDYDDIEVWIRAEGDSSFTLFKTVKANDLEKTEDDTNTSVNETEYGVSHFKVYLPEKTVGYQIKHKSGFFTTKIIAQPNLCLNASNKVYDRVKSDVAAGKNTLIKNKCTLTVTNRSDGAAKDSRDMETNGGFPSSYELSIGESTLYVAQSCDAKATTNPLYPETDENGVQSINAVIEGWGLSSSVDENNERIAKLIDSGVFYDLLPTGFTVDKSTLFVNPVTSNKKVSLSNGAASYNSFAGRDSNFSSGYYSVDLIENWQGSGRTMMKVTINTPEGVKATGYSVWFKMKTTLGNILTNGEAQTNSVCFIDTTEDQSPPKYRYNSISSGIDEKSRIYFKDLDSDFSAFTYGSTKCLAPSQYSTGFKSSVRSEGDVMFKDQTVGLDSGYSYDVSFMNGAQSSQDIIMYDVIENSLTGTEYDWHGEFQSVDISGISSLLDNTYNGSGTKYYCAPVVYYCITDDPITEADLDITKTEIWTTTAPTGADKARVKAVAVDCRYNSKGNNTPFVLPADKVTTNGKKSSITFSVIMKSPESNPENDVMTYNEAHIAYSTNNVAFTNTSLSTVRLHYAYPEFHKTSFPETGKDADHRVGVVNDSTIEYSLSFTNHDEHVNINNIAVEDLLDSDLILTNTVKVAVDDEDPIAINKHTRISEYAITSENGRAKFVATISYLAPDETITIIVPATVSIDPSIDVEHNMVEIDNTARIINVNGSAANIPSETMYHYVTVCKAKIKKVDVNGEGLAGATLQILNKEKTQVLHEFTSTADVYTTNLEPGEYVLRETDTPDNDSYKKAADIPFTIDVEGIHYVNGEKVSYVEMVDEPAYRIVFHENQPDHDDAVFRVYGPGDIKNNGYKIDHFYDIPEWAGDEYVFAGWYHADGYVANVASATIAANFSSDTYPKSDAENPKDYHLYAKWIEVGTVEKATGENGDANNYGDAPIRGFGLAGVQIRLPEYYDENYETEKPGGLRFVTSLSESLYSSINSISSSGVEYGYVVGTETNINTFIEHYGIKDTTKYKLQYKGDNVNGVNTNPEKGAGTAETDFRYITNVNCTKGTGQIKKDHKNFTDYRLYTLVVTYEGSDAEKKNQKIDARAYIRYTDANGMVRVFYNDYKKNMYYGGCLCSFNQVSQIAIPQNPAAQ